MEFDKKFIRGTAIGLITGVSMIALGSSANALETLPKDKSMSGLEYDLVGRNDLWSYQACDSYNESPLTKAAVEAGKLPPIEERLPKNPWMAKTDVMPDGIGEYGGTFRHVIGGRPEGWNWLAGQHSGWGGITDQLMPGLTRLGPLWQIKPEEAEALPNLATRWEWNDDKTELTMYLLEGARWSDGDIFDTEDIDFWYNDNVQNGNVSSWMPKDALGVGTTLEVLGPYSFKFNFTAAKGPAFLSQLAYMGGAPGPSHILKPHHPTYNSDATYESYKNALPASQVPVVNMGEMVPVLHKVDEVVVTRRNPYYWKVDAECNQLPYINEFIYKLTTWDDRTTQALAGTGDFSNMENPGNYVEALKQNKDPDSPVKSVFGSRLLSWGLFINLSSEFGTSSDYERNLRQVFRNKDFRIAISHAMDRDTIGQSVARGPFFHPFAGGYAAGSPYHKFEDSIYYSYNVDKANSILDGLGLKDTDGNGIRNLTSGEDMEIDITHINTYSTDIKIADALVPQFEAIGMRVILKPTNDSQAVLDSGAYSMKIDRNQWVVATKNMATHIPLTSAMPGWHKNNEGDLLPFEEEIRDLGFAIQASDSLGEIADLAGQIQRVRTENVYTVGLVQTPAALLIHKRIKNAHPGVPVYMYEWAEDGLMRPRLWVAKGDQIDEYLPGVLPGL